MEFKNHGSLYIHIKTPPVVFFLAYTIHTYTKHPLPGLGRGLFVFYGVEIVPFCAEFVVFVQFSQEIRCFWAKIVLF